jgi:glycolate oxidase
LWKGRKNAFGAIGRVSPTYYVQDGVVPRTKIAPTLRFIGEVSRRHGLTISNIFHAGDGNMHPIILFDARKPGQLESIPLAPGVDRAWFERDPPPLPNRPPPRPPRRRRHSA